MDTTIRNIHPFIYKKLKAKASVEGITIGEAINRAVKTWLNIEQKKHRSILDIRPEHIGKQYWHLSEDIDEILYKEEIA
jgi:hypothetical protein